MVMVYTMFHWVVLTHFYYYYIVAICFYYAFLSQTICHFDIACLNFTEVRQLQIPKTRSLTEDNTIRKFQIDMFNLNITFLHCKTNLQYLVSWIREHVIISSSSGINDGGDDGRLLDSVKTPFCGTILDAQLICWVVNGAHKSVHQSSKIHASRYRETCL